MEISTVQISTADEAAKHPVASAKETSAESPLALLEDSAPHACSDAPHKGPEVGPRGRPSPEGDTLVHEEKSFKKEDMAPDKRIGPPEEIDHGEIYKLYRGSPCRIDGKSCRIWAEFTSLRLSWAEADQPAKKNDGMSLLTIAACRSVVEEDESGQDVVHVEIDDRSIESLGGTGVAIPGQLLDATPSASSTARAQLKCVAASVESSTQLQHFSEALRKLMSSRDGKDGATGLEFIQMQLFQYLRNHQESQMSTEDLLEAQAVLQFNLHPKRGVQYLRDKVKTGKQGGGQMEDVDVAEWLANMSRNKGGIDPTMLGQYFSRRDTMDIFEAFVQRIDFATIDVVEALRKLFDTLKPGGESQVITRILECFSESYLRQWKDNSDAVSPIVFFKHADSVFQISVSLIMLNTEHHVMPKKVKRNARPPMSAEQYVNSIRLVLASDEVPEEALHAWYNKVKEDEICMEQIPRVPFHDLPVQPDIEGWLVAIHGKTLARYWAVLVLQRMYLFSDESEVEPRDTIDLKDLSIRAIAQDPEARTRFRSQLNGSCCVPLPKSIVGANPWRELADVDDRAFEMEGTEQFAILRDKRRPRNRLVFAAETKDLRQRWVGFSTCPVLGPIN